MYPRELTCLVVGALSGIAAVVLLATESFRNFFPSSLDGPSRSTWRKAMISGPDLPSDGPRRGLASTLMMLFGKQSKRGKTLNPKTREQTQPTYIFPSSQDFHPLIIAPFLEAIVDDNAIKERPSPGHIQHGVLGDFGVKASPTPDTSNMECFETWLSMKKCFTLRLITRNACTTTSTFQLRAWSSSVF